MEQRGPEQQAPQDQTSEGQSAQAAPEGAAGAVEAAARPGRTGLAAGAASAVALVLVALGVWGLGGKPAPKAIGSSGGQSGSLPSGTSGETVPPAQTGSAVSGAVTPVPAAPSAAVPGAAAPEAVAPPPQISDVVTFDLLRAAPDGALMLAGKVAPGAKVDVLLDGAVIDTVTAGGDGSFVSMHSVTPSAEARQMQVRVTGPDGVAKLSEQVLTVAPSPEAVAEAAVKGGASGEEAAAQADAAQAMAARPVVTDEAGARVLASASDQLVIDTLSVGATGQVDISGRGAAKGVVLRAYVDNTEFGLASPADDGSWRMALPAPKAGDHVLRVDALDAQGKVVARAEQGFAADRPVLTETVTTAPDGSKTRVVRIEKGATLWAIAQATYGDPLLYVRVFQANKTQIRDPDLIYPGQVFTLPAE